MFNILTIKCFYFCNNKSCLWTNLLNIALFNKALLHIYFCYKWSFTLKILHRCFYKCSITIYCISTDIITDRKVMLLSGSMLSYNTFNSRIANLPEHLKPEIFLRIFQLVLSLIS